MKKYFSLLFLFIALNSFSQTRPDAFSNNSAIIFHFGRGIHGSGDMSGYNYGITYEHFFTRNIFWNLGFEGTLHDVERIVYFWEDENGNPYDGTFREVNAGFQLVFGAGYLFINRSHHKFGINLNTLARYQATSINGYIVLYPVITDYPEPIVIMDKPGERTLSFGGSLKLFYDYKFTNNYSIGLMGALQMDTNGDVLQSFSIRIGRFF